jgi:hypothetical protein
MVRPIVVLGRETDIERTTWDRVTFIRYHSRGDFLEFILESDWRANVEHKWAALENNNSLPSTPERWMVGIRLIPFLTLLYIGLWFDRTLSRASVHSHKGT